MLGFLGCVWLDVIKNGHFLQEILPGDSWLRSHWQHGAADCGLQEYVPWDFWGMAMGMRNLPELAADDSNSSTTHKMGMFQTVQLDVNCRIMTGQRQHVDVTY